MNQRSLLWHLLLPIGVLSMLVASLVKNSPSSISDTVVGIVANALYLLAPYAGFLLLAATVKPRPITAHAGLLSFSTALLSVLAIGYFGTRDPSGLPYHWVLYWPLCLVGILIFCGVAVVLQRIRGGP
jgi:hypothetical protein